MSQNIFYLVPVAGAMISFFFAWLFFRQMRKQSSGDEKMTKVATAVQKGAWAYLKQQYKVVSVFFVFAAIFFAFLAFVLKVQSPWVPCAFLSGGFFSGLAGYIGMKTATSASSRTTEAAKKSLNSALQVAFRSGAIMGLMVVGLGLLHISLWFIVLRFVFAYPLYIVTSIILASGIGASFYALFARVGGGIYTKAADVGADLVGKVEAGIPEDDPRNPAVIADQVGDNVGDVAGMGADLYESYLGAIVATSVLGIAAGFGLNGIVAPMLIAVVGVLSSIFGIYLVKTKEEDTSQKNLLIALSRGINFSAILIIIFSALVIWLILPKNFGVFGSIFVGLLVGIIIGKSTEFFTSTGFSPTKRIAQASKTGPATVIIEGLSTGMFSTLIPVLVIGTGTILAFWLAGGFTNHALGLYGIGIAAVGMLSTLGITLATDAYGPIADNAGGNAQMTGQLPEVRKRTDALDALGNTTAATGKGFAIGSAALTALALITAYIEEVKIGLERIGIEAIKIGERVVTVRYALLSDFMEYYQIHLLSPQVIVGLMIGAMLAFLFCSLTLRAVGRAAGKMVEEVRRQWRDKEIMNGRKDPDYASCVTIVTRSAQREMILPSLLAIVAPIIIGLILGVAGVVGLLAGALSAGFILAITMANAGGAWDNAKKYIEEGNFGGKGSENHKAAVIGDMLGDPFKDTSGPSLNILIKLMSMISIVVAGLIVTFHLL